MRIRKVEERLDTAIVRRGNRFQGFTPEGETLIRHARKIADDVRALEQDLRAAKGDITGTLVIGVIPTAVIFAARATRLLRRDHPGIKVSIQTKTSLAIQQGLEAGEIDAGITYDEGVSRDLLRVDPLYDEGYLLLVPSAMAPRSTGTATWSEAAELPLCLLEPGMQNRRILDRVFSDQGLVPDVIAQTSGFTASMVLAAEGVAATVLPRLLVDTLHGLDGTIALPLVSPLLEKTVALVTPMRDPSLPTIAAFRRTLTS
jgi:DNA-binding transcriptional LysR family regulator